jgi:hypothetical protein
MSVILEILLFCCKNINDYADIQQNEFDRIKILSAYDRVSMENFFNPQQELKLEYF